MSVVDILASPRLGGPSAVQGAKSVFNNEPYGRAARAGPRRNPAACTRASFLADAHENRDLACLKRYRWHFRIKYQKKNSVCYSSSLVCSYVLSLSPREGASGGVLLFSWFGEERNENACCVWVWGARSLNFSGFLAKNQRFSAKIPPI